MFDLVHILSIAQSLQREPDRHDVHGLCVPHGLTGREDVSQQELHHQHDHLGVGNLPRHAGIALSPRSLDTVYKYLTTGYGSRLLDMDMRCRIY